MAKKNYINWKNDELIKEIDQLQKRKKYGLVWENKSEDVAEQCKEEFPVLEEIHSREVKTDSSKPVNLLIEGDNYHSLSVLNYTHKGKIDVIYIDPPYNTGAKDWKYNNDYVDENDKYRHSKWISMMHNRIKLAKNLLSPDGIMCVAIDNYEIHNLKHILEDIFPNKEIIITVIQHNYRGRVTNNFALTHEYLLWVVPIGGESITRLEDISDEIKRNLRRTGQNSRRKDGPSLFYGIEVNLKTLNITGVTDPITPDKPFPKSTKEDCEIILPIDKNGVERNWYYSGKRVLKEVLAGDVFAKIIKGRIEVHYRKDGQRKLRKSVWSGSKYDSSTHGTELVTKIIGENDFPFPKSLPAVMECILSASSNKNAVVLDFFAGSGTTGHAVLEINNRDGGNRKFILCTNNENSIAEEITYPRVKAVIAGYKFIGNEKSLLFEQKVTLRILEDAEILLNRIGEIIDVNKSNFDKFETKITDGILKVHGFKEIKGTKKGLGGNLKYFKTKFVPASPTDKNRTALTKKVTEMLCIKENTFEKVKSNDQYIIFSKNKQYTGIIYDHQAIDDFKKEIAKIDGKFNVYVFSLGDDTFDEEFEDMKSRVKLSPIPEAILRVYRRIFK